MYPYSLPYLWVLRLLDLCPFRSNSKSSRNLIFSVPVSTYYIDNDHNNVTLQMMLAAVVRDLNELSTSGLDVDGKFLGLICTLFDVLMYGACFPKGLSQM